MHTQQRSIWNPQPQQPPRTIGRVNIHCSVEYDVDGTATPRTIFWPDGRRFEVQQVTGRTTYTPAGGGHGRTRFTCIIKGSSKHIYWDGHRWYVEGKLGSWGGTSRHA